VDDAELVMAEASFDWKLYSTYDLALGAHGSYITAWLAGSLLMEAVDDDEPLRYGGIGLLCEEGRIGVGDVTVRPSAGSDGPSVR
jgi:hypothetical protein